MSVFEWSASKNEWLKLEREVCFEDVVVAIQSGGLIDVVFHKNQQKYPGQKMFIVEIYAYAYLVPFMEDEEKIFLKTIFPSRKATKFYLSR